MVGGAALGLLIGKLSAPPSTGSTGSPGGQRGHLVDGALIGAAAGLVFANFNPWHRWVRGAMPTALSG